MKIKALVLAGFLLATMFFAKTLEAGDFPKRVGYVNDFAGVFSPEESLILENKIQEFRQKTRTEIIVITMESLEINKRPNAYLQELSEAWQTGDNSILLFVVPNLERGGAAMKVSPGLKQSFDPVVAWQVVYKILYVKVRSGQTKEGIEEGVRHIIQYYTERLGRVL